jgi:uncharacterized phage infection (PIP) family protein YhgE
MKKMNDILWARMNMLRSEVGRDRLEYKEQLERLTGQLNNQHKLILEVEENANQQVKNLNKKVEELCQEANERINQLILEMSTHAPTPNKVKKIKKTIGKIERDFQSAIIEMQKELNKK